MRNFSLVLSFVFIFVFVSEASSQIINFESSIQSLDIKIWTQQFDDTVSCRLIEDIPGTYLCLAQKPEDLRSLMGRVSYFVEGRPSRQVVAETDRTYLRSNQANYAGHDIMKSDFEIFFSQLEQLCLSQSLLCPNKYENQLRQFITTDSTRQGFANYAIIAAAIDSSTMSVVSHELLHARYFLNSDYQLRTLEYWQNHVSENERQRIAADLGSIYNIEGPDGEFLLLNEFQAYTLQDDPFKKYDFWISRHRKSLRKFLGDLIPTQSHYQSP